MSHHSRLPVAYGSSVAWQLYRGAPSGCLLLKARARTVDSKQGSAEEVSWSCLGVLSVSERPDEFPSTGLSQASFQKIMQPAWHPPCALPSHRVSRWTARSTRRPRTGKTVSQVLWALL